MESSTMSTKRTKGQKSSKFSKFKSRLRRNAGAWVLMLPMVIAMYFMIWRPQVMGFVWSFCEMKGFNPGKFIGLKNYINVLSDSEFIPVLINTFEYVFWSLIIGYGLPIIAAIMINEMVHFKNGFRVALYIPGIIPGIAAMLIWYFMFYPNETGLLNMFLSLFGQDPYIWLNDGQNTILLLVISMTWRGFGGTMLLYYAALQGINQELYEAAVIDGAGVFKRVINITLPQMSGVMILTFVRQIISVFQVLDQPLTMTGGGPDSASISLGYQLYKYGFVTGRVGSALALGGITFFILVIITSFYFRINKMVEENL